MSNGPIASINLNALQHNLLRVRELAPRSKIIAMVKGNAYGHGLLRVLAALNNADALAVANIDEAMCLRIAGCQKPIVVLNGFLGKAELTEFVYRDFIPVIHEERQLQLLQDSILQRPLPIWMKIDTGMNRLGFTMNEAAAIYQHLSANKNIVRPFVLMTHLADADSVNTEFTRQQIDSFILATKNCVGAKSAANSAAIFKYPQTHLDWVRPGIMLYGVSPFAGRTGVEEGLQPVMKLTARVIACRQVKKGSRVGYGCTWQAPQDMPVAVVAAGYGDGYPRHAVSGTPTYINGKICPLIGRVSMDMLVIDVRAQSNVQVGDEVILWGEHLPIEKIAEKADTIAYELLCNVTKRVRFVEENT